jgi:hypothetical protein
MLLAGCTRISAPDNFSLGGYWQTQGYVCHDVVSTLIVRLEHDRTALTAFRHERDACGEPGDISWLGELASSSTARSKLPIMFSVLVNVHIAGEGLDAVPGLANVLAPDALSIRLLDGTNYSLTRIRDQADRAPTSSRDSSTDSMDDVAAMKDGGGTERTGGAKPHDADTGSRTDGTQVADAGSTDGDSMRDSGSQPADANSGSPGREMPAADSGRPEQPPSPAPEPDAASPEPPSGGSSGGPMEPAAGADAPPHTEPPPDDGWVCRESVDREGLPYCVCGINGDPTSDNCVLPKPPCCFTLTTLFEQCTCYQADSEACHNFTEQSATLGTTPVPTCPPR